VVEIIDQDLGHVAAGINGDAFDTVVAADFVKAVREPLDGRQNTQLAGPPAG